MRCVNMRPKRLLTKRSSRACARVQFFVWRDSIIPPSSDEALSQKPLVRQQLFDTFLASYSILPQIKFFYFKIFQQNSKAGLFPLWRTRKIPFYATVKLDQKSRFSWNENYSESRIELQSVLYGLAKPKSFVPGPGYSKHD